MHCRSTILTRLKSGRLAALLLIILTACQASPTPTRPTLPTVTATPSMIPPTISPTPTATVIVDERQALVALYEATDGDHWSNKDGWLSDQPVCTWAGVTCINDHVVSLNLSHNKLQGKLPPEIGWLSSLRDLYLTNDYLSELPSEIGQLSNLQMLYLSSYQLSKLPPEIGRLSKLQRLYVEGDPRYASPGQLVTLPPQIGQLTNLQELGLYSNQLLYLPPEIGRLSNLQRLDLAGNQLEELPLEIGQLTNLQWLDLSGNQMNKMPPAVGQLTGLRMLELGQNHLPTLLPEIGRLSNLQGLYLSDNQLSVLPPEIGQATNIQWLELSNNQLSELPTEIGQLVGLEVLYLSGNPLSEIPPEIVQLGNLQKLILPNGQLSELPGTNLIDTSPVPTPVFSPTLEGPGGFTTPSFDITLLPLVRPFYGEGPYGYSECMEQWADTLSSGEESVSPDFKVIRSSAVPETYYLCILGYPATEETSIQAELISPTGQQYAETFVAVANQYGATVKGQLHSETPSSALQGEIEMSGDTPIITIGLGISAGLPEGHWNARITAQTNEGPLENATTFELKHEDSWLDVLSYPDPDPFRRVESLPGAHLKPGQTFYFFGVHFPPESPLIIALYSGRPAYATRVMSNSEGRLETTFVIGSDVHAGSYSVDRGIDPNGLSWKPSPIFLNVDE